MQKLNVDGGFDGLDDFVVKMKLRSFAKKMTIMDFLQAIDDRHSVRRYTPMPLGDELVERLRDAVDECNAQSGLHIQLVLDEPKAFDCWLARYGKFSGVTHYFAMIGDKGIERFDEQIGYYGEYLVLLAQTLGLNTCWVGLSYTKIPEALDLGVNEKLRCVIALGHGAEAGKKHHSKPIEKVVECEGEMPTWFKDGVVAALKAPTAINQQKFKFSLLGDHQVRARAGLGFYAKVDLGIVKRHFEIAAGIENFSWAD